jgi:prepilin-type N-terminal cleavage/methylation domain-containing protein
MRLRRSDGGLTLIELVVVMAIFGLLMTITYSILTSVQQQTTDTIAVSDDVGQARLALQQIDRQVRSGNVLYSPANEASGQPNGTVGCYGFTVAPSTVGNAGNCMRVYTQANGDNRCVQWRVSGGVLATRSWSPTDPDQVTPWRTVARNIVNTDDVNSAANPPAFLLQGATSSYGTRLVDIVFQVKNTDQNGPPVTVQTALSGRNTQYGYDPSVCTPVPASS